MPVSGGAGGGGYQYSLAVLNALSSGAGTSERIAILTGSPSAVELDMLSRGWELCWVRNRAWRQLARSTAATALGPARTNALIQRLRSIRPPASPTYQYLRPAASAVSAIARLRLDLILELGYSGYGLAVGLPFIMPIHDLQHRISPGFPEVGNPDEWASRDAFLTRAIAQAQAILVDSEIGKGGRPRALWPGRRPGAHQGAAVRGRSLLAASVGRGSDSGSCALRPACRISPFPRTVLAP